MTVLYNISTAVLCIYSVPYMELGCYLYCWYSKSYRSLDGTGLHGAFRFKFLTITSQPSDYGRLVTVWMLSDVFHVLFPLSPFPLPPGRYSMALLYCFFSSDIPLWPLEPHYNVTSSALLWALTCGVCPGFDKVLYFPSLYYQC